MVVLLKNFFDQIYLYLKKGSRINKVVPFITQKNHSIISYTSYYSSNSLYFQLIKEKNTKVFTWFTALTVCCIYHSPPPIRLRIINFYHNKKITLLKAFVSSRNFFFSLTLDQDKSIELIKEITSCHQVQEKEFQQ